VGPKLRYAGSAAFCREDVADAHRGHPEVDLAEYAATRRLEVLGSNSAAGYFAAMPGEDDLQFNVLRGMVTAGEYGIVFHELLAWEVFGDRPAGNGTFYGVRYGRLFRKPGSKPPEDAFGIPATTAATQVPEATAAGDWSIDNQPRPPLTSGGTKLGEHGLPGWHLMHDDDVADEFVERLLAGSGLRSVLERERGRPFFQVRFRRGALLVRCNGWLGDAAMLDTLTSELGTLTPEVRVAGLGVADPRPFAEPLPAADWPPDGVSVSARFPPDPWLVPLHAFARDHGLVIRRPSPLSPGLPDAARAGPGDRRDARATARHRARRPGRLARRAPGGHA
jgi:hypothetical protein